MAWIAVTAAVQHAPHLILVVAVPSGIHPVLKLTDGHIRPARAAAAYSSAAGWIQVMPQTATVAVNNSVHQIDTNIPCLMMDVHTGLIYRHQADQVTLCDCLMSITKCSRRGPQYKVCSDLA